MYKEQAESRKSVFILKNLNYIRLKKVRLLKDMVKNMKKGIKNCKNS